MNPSKAIYEQRINKVIDYIHQDLSKSYSLEELASVAHFSTFHFHRIFVAMTGESVNFFSNRLRLEKAARLLRYSKNTISTLAMDCGFSSPATFSRSFKNYFGTSPSAYKKTGIIENSKICKELFSIDQYLVPMTDQELATNFPVEIRDFPERRVAYIRIVDSYREGVVLEAFGQLIEWAKQEKVFAEGTVFGMSIDDPLTTPKEKYRYETCITLPENFTIDTQSGIECMTIPKCQYAVMNVSGEFNRVATATHYLFNQWLINSDYEPAHLHGLEIFLDKEKVCDWSSFDLDLCIPIQKLKNF